MTVDDLQMRVRARGTRPNVDNADEERWKELAHVRDGRREKWMTDRAKHALGTPKLASIFLREEKGRVHRLRKIKSVLASGNLMGNGGGAPPYYTAQADRRGRRRPHGNLPQQSSPVDHTSHRRFPKTEDIIYPTNPFGNIGKDAQLFPEPAMRRSSLVEAARNCRSDDNSLDCFKAVSSDDSRAIQQVVSILGGGEGDLYGSQSDLDEIREAPSRREGQQGSRSNRKHQSNSSEPPGEIEQTPRGTGSHNDTRDAAERSHAISSGPSAIDLFDQCGLVPMAAVEKEGLVGTTSTFRPGLGSQEHEEKHGNDMMTSMTDRRYPVPPVLVAPKPPLIPDGAFSTTTRSHARDAQARASRASSKRSQATMRHGVRPRPPFSGSSVSSPSRTQHGQLSQVVAGASRYSGKTRRGVQNETASTEATSRRSRVAVPLTVSSPLSQTGTPGAEGGNRARRLWKVDGESAIATPSVPKSSGAMKGVESTEAKAPSSFASASASEQRIASAKERLHKDKGLDALKSEHVEALSILQHISCPSTATMAAEASPGIGEVLAEKGGGDGTAEGGTVEAAQKKLLHRGKEGLATAAGTNSNVGTGGCDGLPADAQVDELSADLPRIGSREQAELRKMYREWWMKVANGGSPPTLSAPDDTSGGQRIDLAGTDEAIDPSGTTLPLDRRSLPLTDRAMLERDIPVAGAARFAGKVEDKGSLPDDGRPLGPGVGGVAGVVKHEAPATSLAGDDAAVAEPPQVARQNSLRSDKSCPNESEGGGAQDDTVTRGRETGINSSWVDRTTSTDIDAEKPASKEGDVIGSAPLSIGAEVTPREEERDAAEEVLATDGALVSSSPKTAAEASPQKQQEQEQEQEQPCGSDVESVSEDDDLEEGQEEGLHGRIYLPDGRFVSTLHHSGGEMTADATERISRLGEGGWGDDDSDEVVVDKPARKKTDDDSLGYADEEFEFED